MGSLFSKTPALQPQAPMLNLDPISYGQMERNIVESSRNQKDYSPEKDQFEIWNGTSVSQGGFILLHLYHNEPYNETLMPMARMFRRYLKWYEANKPQYIFDQTQRLSEILWVCEKLGV
jgi:hypothetical protein